MDKIILVMELRAESTQQSQYYLRLSSIEGIRFVEFASNIDDPRDAPSLQRLELLTPHGNLLTKYPFHTAIQWAECFDPSFAPSLTEDRCLKLWAEVLNLLRFGLLRAPSLLTDSDGKYNSTYNGCRLEAWYKRVSPAETGRYIGFHIGLCAQQIARAIDSIGLRVEPDELIQLFNEHLESIEWSGKGDLCLAADASLSSQGRLDWNPIERP